MLINVYMYVCMYVYSSVKINTKHVIPTCIIDITIERTPKKLYVFHNV